MYDVITLGEPLIRYEPTNQFERLERTSQLNLALGGAEVNITAALANIGKLNTAIITKLPDNPMGRWVEHFLDYYNVSTEFITHGGSRIGAYFSERGSHPRTAAVTYDREHSAFLESTISDYSIDYHKCAKIFHTTGITLALNENTRAIAFEMIKKFKEANTLVSFDVNYRANLWSEEKARECIARILPFVDILFISEETLRKMFKYGDNPNLTLKEILQDFGTSVNAKIIASTKRKVIDQAHHQFSSVIYDNSHKVFFETERPYDIQVVDRVGSGDAYIAGVLYGLLQRPYNFKCDEAQEFGDAFSALKCTIPGDILISTKAEIESLIDKHKKGIKSDIAR